MFWTGSLEQGRTAGNQRTLVVLAWLKISMVETQPAFPLRARTFGMRVRPFSEYEERLRFVMSRDNLTMALATHTCSTLDKTTVKDGAEICPRIPIPFRTSWVLTAVEYVVRVEKTLTKH